MIKKAKGWFMNIKDKITIISYGKYCPPHYLPHKFPIGKKITKEHCHIHHAKWRMKHHVFFCKKLKCKHYDFMLNTSKQLEKEIAKLDQD